MMQVVGATRHFLYTLVFAHVFPELVALPSPIEGLAHGSDRDAAKVHSSAPDPDGRLMRREIPSSVLAEKEIPATPIVDQPAGATPIVDHPAGAAPPPLRSVPPAVSPVPAAAGSAPQAGPLPHARAALPPQPPPQQPPAGVPAAKSAAPPPVQTAQPAETPAARDSAAGAQQPASVPANPLVNPPPPPITATAKDQAQLAMPIARGASPVAVHGLPPAVSGHADQIMNAPPAGPGGTASGATQLVMQAPPANDGHQSRAAALLAVGIIRAADPVTPPAALASVVDASADENAFFAAVASQIQQAWFLHGDPLFIMVGARPYLLSPSKDAPVKTPEEVAKELGQNMQDPVAVAQAAYNKNVANMLLWVSDVQSLLALAKDFKVNVVLDLQMKSKLRGFFNGQERNKDNVLQMDHGDLVRMGWSTLWARGGMGREGVLKLAVQANGPSSLPSGSAALIEDGVKAESRLSLNGSEDELATQAKELLLALAPSK